MVEGEHDGPGVPGALQARPLRHSVVARAFREPYLRRPWHLLQHREHLGGVEEVAQLLAVVEPQLRGVSHTAKLLGVGELSSLDVVCHHEEFTVDELSLQPNAALLGTTLAHVRQQALAQASEGVEVEHNAAGGRAIAREGELHLCGSSLDLIWGHVGEDLASDVAGGDFSHLPIKCVNI